MPTCTLSTSVDAETAIRLDRLTKSRGLTVSALLRQLVDDWLTENGSPSPILSGPLVRDISEEPDEDYYG
jgi:hypothetical protein